MSQCTPKRHNPIRVVWTLRSFLADVHECVWAEKFGSVVPPFSITVWRLHEDPAQNNRQAPPDHGAANRGRGLHVPNENRRTGTTQPGSDKLSRGPSDTCFLINSHRSLRASSPSSPVLVTRPDATPAGTLQPPSLRALPVLPHQRFRAGSGHHRTAARPARLPPRA